MIKTVEVNLLEAKERCICHQVNCQGVMGSGVALQIKRKYPQAYKDYKILDSLPSGGKAGKGYNKTTSVQACEWVSIDRHTGEKLYSVRRYFRFPVGDAIKRRNAIAKAKAWIDKNGNHS